MVGRRKVSVLKRPFFGLRPGPCLLCQLSLGKRKSQLQAVGIEFIFSNDKKNRGALFEYS